MIYRAKTIHLRETILDVLRLRKAINVLLYRNNNIIWNLNVLLAHKFNNFVGSWLSKCLPASIWYCCRM